ncbi:PREDICTED: phosphorylated adapter RNA export protein [Rhagoletis zephyria]|uniref:phosphorylated adapter RNA export protein n=1 Tax=Rhagoletis zephyria TaxID=28612 RepID=UPI0008113DE1|nr:PREDICTED: phosphorylated adapter RNA export protein [Rhagoletis zephyria]
MMELNANTYDVDLEDGELSASSDDVYTPLQRPSTLSINTSVALDGTATIAEQCSPLATCHDMQRALEEDDLEDSHGSSGDSSSSESSDACLKKLSTNSAHDGSADAHAHRKRRKRVRRTVMVRVPPADMETQEKRARFKKYNIWTAALQEEALTEDMRGCEVAQVDGAINDRNVENYDFSLHRRLNGGNCLKRRLSNSTDDFSDNELMPVAKRGRCSSEAAAHRRSVKSRLGYRSRTSRGRRGSSPTSGSDTSYEPRNILDLEPLEGRDPADIAREMSNKLHEEKDELFVRIVDVLGTKLPVEIYKETQRIEADGGMMIMNGKRRRTPGGVFLFLLKNHQSLTLEEHKFIFSEDRQRTNKWKKEMEALSRERKVEELKKRLSEQEKDLPALSTRKEHILLGSNLENQSGNLSNPPPSPVGNEQSPDYKAHAINHVPSDADTDASPDKPSTSASALAALTSPSKELVGYDDDFLDVNCGEMDFI